MDQTTGLSSSELLQAQAHVWNHTFSIINSAALNCAVELAIPDVIHRNGKPMTAVELAVALPIPPSKTSYLSRIMRLLTHNGFFICDGGEAEEDDSAAYGLTPASKLLLRDHPFSVAPFTQHLLTQGIMAPLVHLGDWFKNGAGDENPFQSVHGGRPFYDYGAGDPKRGETLEELMVNDCRLVASLLLHDCRWVFEGVKTLVEVGGRRGILASAIAEEFPEMEVSVLDLPDVVAASDASGKNFKYVAGDMFDEIPSSDVILFKWVFIDCLEEAALKALKSCREALSKNGRGKVVLIEEVVKSQQADEEPTQTLLMFDILEMATIFGRLRSEKQWAKLFSDAGFSTYKITPMSKARSLIEVFP